MALVLRLINREDELANVFVGMIEGGISNPHGPQTRLEMTDGKIHQITIVDEYSFNHRIPGTQQEKFTALGFSDRVGGRVRGQEIEAKLTRITLENFKDVVLVADPLPLKSS